MRRISVLIAGVFAGAALFGACGRENAPPVEVVLPEISIDASTLANLPEEHRALVGSTWLVGEFVGRFTGPDTVFIAGEPLAATAPAGMEATYTYRDGIIEIAAEGHVKSGTWDGENLVIDGSVGVRQ